MGNTENADNKKPDKFTRADILAIANAAAAVLARGRDAAALGILGALLTAIGDMLTLLALADY